MCVCVCACLCLRACACVVVWGFESLDTQGLQLLVLRFNMPNLLLKEEDVCDGQCRRHGRIVPAPDHARQTTTLFEGAQLVAKLIASLCQGKARWNLQRICQNEDCLLKFPLQIGQRTYLLCQGSNVRMRFQNAVDVGSATFWKASDNHQIRRGVQAECTSDQDHYQQKGTLASHCRAACFTQAF